jgi:hypothetical protein
LSTTTAASSSSKKSAKKAAKSAKKQAKQTPKGATIDAVITARARDLFLDRTRKWAVMVFVLALSNEVLRSTLLDRWQLLEWLEVREVLLTLCSTVARNLQWGRRCFVGWYAVMCLHRICT